MQYDFSGYATRNDIRCADGRIIRQDAFKDCDGKQVPIVWQHIHNDANNVLGHGVLENRPDGVYFYGKFNDTPQGRNARTLVGNKDITSLSIYANHLIQEGSNVIHGLIREVSLVLAGANDGAFIDNICFAHADGMDDILAEEAIIYMNSPIDYCDEYSVDDGFYHSDDEEDERTVGDVLDTFTDEQREVMYYVIDEILNDINDERIEHSDDVSKTLGDIYDAMSDDKKRVIEMTIAALSGKARIDVDTKSQIAKSYNKMSNDEKSLMHYVIGASAKNRMAHGDMTLGDIYNTMNDRQRKVIDVVVTVANSNGELGETAQKQVLDVYNTMNDDQKEAFHAIIGMAGQNRQTSEISHSDNRSVMDIYESMSYAKKALIEALLIAVIDNETPSESLLKEMNAVFNEMSNSEQDVLYALVGVALANNYGTLEQSDFSYEGETEMKNNIFDVTEEEVAYLSHDDVESIFADAKQHGSLKDSVLAHGIDNIEYLFPDAQTINKTPDFISREMEWVRTVMTGTHHTPFSRIKSVHANITEDEARARGYIKGKKKLDEVFTLLKRTTTPQTVYKKQKLDRDDVIDITDFDVVAWIKAEMRTMLDEEIARAILVGDGRQSSSDDKINEQHIRPIWTDADLYTVNAVVKVAAGSDEDTIARATIKQAIRARKNYKGSGNPVLFTTEDVVTEMLLIENKIGERIYKTEAELATAMRVSKIITVPVMEGLTRTVTPEDGSPEVRELLGIIVNLKDYNVGADKGGEVNMFDDFDIDYNQQKYLIETRCSGALVKPYSAIALEKVTVEAAG